MSVFETPQSVCRFGVAVEDITPPVGIYHRMWGAAAHDRSSGVHRPLTASAIAFQDWYAGEEPQLVVALDHCLLTFGELEQLNARVCEAADVTRERLLVTFSHIHAAGLMDRRRADLPGGDLIGPYLDEMASCVASAVRDAVASLQPVTITYATGRCSLAAHRDYWDEHHGAFVCGFNPHQTADDTVLFARVTDEDGGTLATVVNYACHPTTLAWDNQRISPDFPGATREVVQQATGAPCVFLQGASGELGPQHGYVQDTDVADRNGRQLGYAALAACESLPPPRTKMHYRGPVTSGALLGVWSDEPLSDDELQARCNWKARRWRADLSYRADLPTVEQMQADLDHWLAEEQAARKAGDSSRATESRARAEQKRRQRTRLLELPPGDQYPLPITAWRAGDAIWIAVEGEPYSQLQTSLRDRFPHLPLIVIALSNGARACYLPPAEIYGKGIYQESIALLEKGCLEELTDAIADQIGRWIE